MKTRNQKTDSTTHQYYFTGLTLPPVFALFILLASACCGASANKLPQETWPSGLLLARVDMHGSPSAFPLPIYAGLQDAAGQEYVLVKATADELEQSGWIYQVLDARIESANHILAYEFRDGARQSALGQFQIVHDDGRRLIVRAASNGDVERLADLGFQCRLLASAPLSLAPSSKEGLAPAWRMVAIASNASVAAMIAQVKQTNLLATLNELTGIQPVLAGGSYAAILTRHLNSGTPLQRATALAYERFSAAGLQSSYQAWTASGKSNRNVVGVRTGTTAPSEIVVICAHIDDMPASGNAPGADDNASGSAGVLAAAEIMRPYSFGRTLRFVIFTGEEQGLLGSEAYARAARTAGDTIVAVLNLDMVAWDGNGDKAMHLYVRPTSDSGHAGDRDIAATFTNVVRTYGLQPGLSPEIIAEVSDWSDHYSFTSHGYASVCAIEEDVADFNPYYHTANDTVARLNLPYYTRFVQAVVGTAAHLALPQNAAAWMVATPASTNVPAAAASGRQIAVAANVPWTAATNAPWLRITSGGSGTTNGTVTYSVTNNAGTSSRTGRITVAGGGITRTCTVVQAGAASPWISISPASTNVPAAAASGRQIAVAANVPWTAATNAPWLRITSGASGTANGTVTYSVTNNAGTSSRTGRITVAGGGITRTCTVVQAGAALSPSPVLSRSAVNVKENGEGRFFARLNGAPSANTTVSVARVSGDANVTVKGGASLVFTAANWSTWKVVTLAAADDADAANGTATIRVTMQGAAPVDVTATELDDDIGANLALASGGTTITGTQAVRTGQLIDGIHNVQTNYGYTVWTNVARGTMTLDLKTTATVSRVRLLNWDWSYRVHRYRIDSSLNGTTWSSNLVDASTGTHTGWEDWAISRTARYLRFTGLSNSANFAVCLAEWEVYGTRLAGRRSLAPLPNSSGIPVARPVTVVTSDDGAARTNGWAAVDGDTNTLWEGRAGAGGWHIAIGYDSTLTVTNLVLDLAEGSPTRVESLYSLDAEDWLPLPLDPGADPVALNYLWLLFPADDLSPAAPRVIEIRPQQ